jgi:hypothetical protein
MSSPLAHSSSEPSLAMPDLPSGTVTFHFTDVAESTAPWERDRDALHAGGRRREHG